MKPVKVGLCGLGTVGSGTFNVLQRNLNEISARASTPIELSHIGARRDNPACDTTNYQLSRDIFAVVDDPEVDIVVELIGGTTVAKELVEKAIANKKHVVTANKALIAEFGNELFAKAQEQGVCIAYEAAVAGGIPIIKAMREGLAANHIEWLAGIINGTGNFILTEMRDKGRDFADVLKEAQELGYAEADPTFDVEGIDAAHKLVILASLAFAMPLQYDKVFCEGISTVQPVDVKYAEELGYRIKHLGIARRRDEGIELRVHPTLIPHKRLIANVDGVMNSVLVQGEAVGPTLYYGAGAGAEPTASAVIADIVDVARAISSNAATVPALGFAPEYLQDHVILPIDAVETAYYLRMSALDKPGVMNQITQILSNAGASIEALIQKERESESQDHVDVALLTNSVLEADMKSAIEQIEALDSISGQVSRIRMEALG
ncbi:homoserine dehydrogenase [Pseudoteredinibacter isoporae]|uniref:Homoserine dehydrogenase n=1 Tax=Pseudoteredinibacter isoporae TaxID=570281 RepID=A0A7X0MVT6_9GAMM|nr:homoserine dehydrogenase [Pseudoteredinibacter isoporae]MBB6522046.1 homoserine dehydrogenase [Pseudoteredinibacter isoporae]NHO87581.1 homoserine dehydrogenase [Pseudoteredinibacter isoporae]NIB24088.1 homoserine dehydrogenase [Pseudoteredinibacter isoporae]